MRQEFLRNFAFLRAPYIAHGVFATFRRQRFVALQEFLGLDGVVRKRLGGGINGGEAAADDHDRQSHLHIGN